MAGQLLTCLGRLFTTFLKLNGFTLGMEDILVNDKVWSAFGICPTVWMRIQNVNCGWEIVA